jgi:hypothetical protein
VRLLGSQLRLLGSQLQPLGLHLQLSGLQRCDEGGPGGEEFPAKLAEHLSGPTCPQSSRRQRAGVMATRGEMRLIMANAYGRGGPGGEP